MSTFWDFWTYRKVPEILECWIFGILTQKFAWRCQCIWLGLAKIQKNSTLTVLWAIAIWVSGHWGGWNISHLFVVWRVNNFLCNVIWELWGTFLATKRHLLRISVISGFVVNWWQKLFSDGLLHVLCMGWEVEFDMNGHSSHCLRVHNVKMKKFSPGQKWGTFQWIFRLRGRSVYQFE